MKFDLIVDGYRVLFEPDEDGFHVWAPGLKGCHSWGSTKEEAEQHISEAIQSWLESAPEEGIQIPAAGTPK